MDKLTIKIQELELENTQFRVQINRAKEHNYTLEDKGKMVCEKFATNKKKSRKIEGRRVWVGGGLQRANSELDARNDQLDQEFWTIRDLKKTVERSNSIKKEARQDYKAQIHELRTTLKECKELLAKEQLEREKIHPRFLHE